MKTDKGEYLFWGSIVLIIGVIFLIRNLGYQIHIFQIFRTYWPVILILIGLKNVVYYIKQEK